MNDTVSSRVLYLYVYTYHPNQKSTNLQYFDEKIVF